ncbi:UNVERIFIED_ORG: hypothetical protein M2328_002742 [Rhodococcus erythropolis]
MAELLTCDDVRRQINQRTIDRVASLRAMPLVRIWDKNWDNGTGTYKPVAIVRGEIDGDFEDVYNNTGIGRLRLLSSHPLRDWLIDDVKEAEDIHITVDVPGWRWHGKALTVDETMEEDGLVHVTLTFQHGFEHAKKLICFPNPFAPIGAQAPKQWNWAGNAATGIGTLMFVNMLRRYAPNWKQGDNIFHPETWKLNLNPADWPQVLNPRGLGRADTSMWSVFTTRAGKFFDVVEQVLKETGLHLIADRWLPGDPQPCPEFFILYKPTLVWRIVDKSGVRGPTGTSLDGLLKLVATVAQDGINEIVETVSAGQAPPEYGKPGFFGTITEWPWVCWRPAMYYARERGSGISGVRYWRRVIHKSLAGAIATGGKSPAWLNSSIKLLLNAALGYLGSMFGNSGLALGIFDKQVEDVLFAFARLANPIRQALMGSDAYGEEWEPGDGTGLSAALLSTFRMGFWNTRAYTSFKLRVINGAPYWVGRHFGLGDRVAAEIGRFQLYVDQVHSLRYSWSRTKDPTFDVGIGDDSEEAPPTSRLARMIDRGRAALHKYNLSA